MRLSLWVPTLVTAAMAAATLTGCGNKNSGPAPEVAPAAPTLPGTVQPDAFSGRPGRFTGLWRGDCVVESQGAQSDRCSLIISIAQEPGLLDVTMDLRYSFRGQVAADKHREIFTVIGNRITGRNGRSGLIGPEIFTLVSPSTNARQGMARYTFAKTGPRQMTLTMEANMPQYTVVLRGDLRGSRPIPRARPNSRN